jgi:circadian clock protein KaiC
MNLPRSKGRKVEAGRRLTTGVGGLDEVLSGGIPLGSTVFISGLPGTGKTVLTQQIAWANARRGEPVLYLSTLSEPTLKSLRYASDFSFFDDTLVGTSVVYGEIGGVLKAEGPTAALAHLDGLVKERRPALLVIDSFKVIRELFEEATSFRAFTTELVIRLSLWGITAILVGEYTDEDIRSLPEFAIADGIIYLHGTEEGLRQERHLRLMKMRGTDLFGGDHVFDITSSGIVVYPRMRPEVVGEYRAPSRRITSAIEGLDEMLGGGVFDSTSVLIYGSAGSGKTLTALSFLVGGARGNSPGVLVTLEESAQQILRNAEAFQWDLGELMTTGLLDILHLSPSELNIDRHASVIRDRVLKMKASLVVIDSISALEASVISVEKYYAYLWAINDHFKRSGVTVVATCELAAFTLSQTEQARRVSLFADTLLVVRTAEVDAPRSLGVVKMRGSAHDVGARELVIEPPIIRIGAPARSQRS